MPDYTDYRQLPHAPGSFLVDTGEDREQYGDDPSNSQNSQCIAADRAEDVQGYPQSYHPYDHTSTERYPQAMAPYQIPSHMAHQNGEFQYGTSSELSGPASIPGRYDCIDPILLTTPGPSHGQISSFNSRNDQFSGYDSHSGQATSMSYVYRQQECLSGTWDAANTLHYPRGQDIDLLPGCDEGVENQIHDPSVVPQDIKDNRSIGEPQGVFVAAVLDRSDNHQAILRTYTDELVGQMGVSTDVTYMQGHTTSTFVDPNLRIGSIGSSQAPTISTGPLQAIQTQGTLGDGDVGLLIDRSSPSGFQYFVEDSTREVVNPSVSGSQSGLASGGMLHPYSNSQYSDAASLASTDTSSDALNCPLDGCEATFTGRHRRGNWGRHRRQKHGNRIVEYLCEDEHCTRTFQRKDARLKHYRKAHSYLIAGSALPDNFSAARGVWIHAGDVHTNNDQGSPYGSQISFDDGNMPS